MTAVDDGVLALWLSTDRALQLSEAIRTFCHFAALPLEGAVRHVVLYAYSSQQHERSYAQLAASLPTVSFLDERREPEATTATPQSQSQSGHSHFAAHLRAVLDSSSDRFVLLCVDDALFVAPFSVPSILRLFESPSLLSYHLALHPALTRHQPSSSPLALPTFTAQPSDQPSTSPPSLHFSHSAGGGSHDFRYPFSLVASLYRLADVRRLVHELSHSASLPIHHPNHFESSGNTHISTHAALPPAVRSFLPPPTASDASALTALRPLSGIPTRPVCVVLTVNRVQEVYANAVFDSVDGSVEAMLRKFEAGGWQFDERRYGELADSGHFTSVHVGELVWKHKDEAETADTGRREAEG